MRPLLSVSGINCRYDDEIAVRNTSFDLVEGQLACLLGPSGCGKTTVLRAIAGFQDLLGGSITLGKHLHIRHRERNLPPEQRNLSMVFQDHALFPHLTVARNVGAGLRDMDRKDAARVVAEMLSYVGLGILRGPVFPTNCPVGSSSG